MPILRFVSRSTRCAVLASLVAGSISAERAIAIGSQVLLKSDGSPDGFYYSLDGTDASRYITEYAAHDFDPGDVIVGARLADYGSGARLVGGLVVEIRFEDPLNPGFPDLGPDGLVGSAIAGLDNPCGPDATFRREIAFDSLEAPAARTAYLVVGLPISSSDIPCGIQLDTSSARQGASKCYLASRDRFLYLLANHLAEVRIQRTVPQDLDMRVHGTARFVGDEGRPLVFARRANSGSRPTDDFVSLEVVVDNREPQPVSLSLQVWADPKEILPGRRLVDLTAGFRFLGGGGRLTGLRTFPRGRTVIHAEFARTLPRWVLSKLPAGIGLTAHLNDPYVPTVPRDQESTRVGLRPAAGVHDDASTEQALLVSSPSLTGDSLAVRFPLVDLPRVPFAVWGVEVVGYEAGDTVRNGYDAIEVRRQDPILTGGPDPSAEGLFASVGLADGVAEVDMNDAMSAKRFFVRQFDVDPAAPSTTNLWAQVVLAPSDTFVAGTVLGADLDASTLLRDSYFSNEGTLPFVPDPVRNYQIRLLVGEWSQPFQSDPADDFDPLPMPPGGYIVSGGPQPISISVVATEDGGRGRD